MTAGSGVDRLIEVEFGSNLALFTKVVRPGGIVSSYGSATAMTVALDFGTFQAHGLTLHFRSVHQMDPSLRAVAVDDLADFVGRGLWLPVIQSFPLGAVAEAHRIVEAGSGGSRVILCPSL